MKSKLIALIVFAFAAGACSSANPGPQSASNAQAKETASAHTEHAAHPAGVPAYEDDPKELPPTLDPAKFTGMTRQAYAAAREIPRTLAQLPCYCHCDRGFGHKSLQSCYVDDHASSCATCVEEALAAYRMEKEEHLAPAQIRERIIAQFSTY